MKGGILSTDTGLEFANDEFQRLLKQNDLAWKSKGVGQSDSDDQEGRVESHDRESWEDVERGAQCCDSCV